MAGMIIPLFTKREFSFSADTTVPVVKVVDVSQYTEGSLIVRTHDATISAGSIVVRARTTAPCAEDPSQDFIDTSSDVATVTLTTTASTGELGRGSLSSNFGGFLRIEVEGNYTSGTLDATISADLVVKS